MAINCKMICSFLERYNSIINDQEVEINQSLRISLLFKPRGLAEKYTLRKSNDLAMQPQHLELTVPLFRLRKYVSLFFCICSAMLRSDTTYHLLKTNLYCTFSNYTMSKESAITATGIYSSGTIDYKPQDIYDCGPNKSIDAVRDCGPGFQSQGWPPLMLKEQYTHPYPIRLKGKLRALC